MSNKKNGVYYTPQVLADYLVRPLIKKDKTNILDPSYGEGSLLLAAERAFKEKRVKGELHLFGCDIKPVNGLLKHLPEANLKETDFFNYPIENRFETILMNPPYVRHNIQNYSKIKKYRSDFPVLNFLNGNSDLWAYFLVKAVSHLETGGNIGAVLPWAFLQADYAKPIREWLASIFQRIKAVALSTKFFESADERIVVLWLEDYGKECQSIKIGSAKNIDTEITFSDVSLSNWNSNNVSHSQANGLEEILTRLKTEHHFTELSEHADIKIGVVTGAVDYFIMPRKEANELGFRSERLIPILTTAKDFPDYLKNGRKNLDVMIKLKKDDHLKFRSFIKKGVDEKINLRSHSKFREPWYSVKIGQVPDALFHYRVTKTPYLIPNVNGVQCTNSIHRVYYKNLSVIQMKWIIVSILSTASQVSIEAKSKTYGRGILKIEPAALKKALVVKRNDSSINSVYKEIIKLLALSKREEASRLATSFLYRELEVPKELERSIESTLINLQSLRIK